MAKDDKSKLLEIRRKMKAKKPNFVRDDSFKVKRVKSSWRRPKGLQAKLRLGYRHAGRHISVGFSSPAAVRGLDRSGLRPVVIANVASLDCLDAAADGVIVSGTVGGKKRLAIIEAAQKKKLTILNVKDAAAFLADAQKKFESRKSEADKKLANRQKKRDAAAKKKDESLDKKVEDKAEKKPAAEKSESKPAEDKKEKADKKTADSPKNK